MNEVHIAYQAESASDIIVWGRNHFRDFCEMLGHTPKLIQDPKPIRAANKTLAKVEYHFMK